jgi:hypothetical protein
MRRHDPRVAQGSDGIRVTVQVQLGSGFGLQGERCLGQPVRGEQRCDIGQPVRADSVEVGGLNRAGFAGGFNS